MGELALVGDYSTVPLTRISCNTVFSKSQNARKVGTLCIFSYFCNRQSKNSFFGQKLKISRFFKQSKDSYFSLNKKLNLTNVLNFFYQGYFFSALLATFNCGFYFLSEDRAKSSQFKTKHDVSLFEF